MPEGETIGLFPLYINVLLIGRIEIDKASLRRVLDGSHIPRRI